MLRLAASDLDGTIGDTASYIEASRETGVCCLTAAWATSAVQRRHCARLNGGRIFLSVAALSAHITAIARQKAEHYVSAQK